MASEGSKEYVTLKGGLTLPVEALQLAWSLEARGATLEVEGEDTLVVEPGGGLTDADCAAIRRWKRHLLALVRYCDTVTV